MAKPNPTYRASVYSTGQASSYATSGTYTPAVGSLLVAFIETSLAASPVDPTSVTGHGVTFSKLTLASSTISTTHKVSVWVADAGASPTSAAVTASFGGNQTGCSIIEYEVTNADLGGGATAAIVQNPVGTGTGTTGTVTLASASATDNVELAFFVHLANEGTTPRTNWTETAGADGNFNSPATGAAAQFRTDAYETTSTATWSTSSAWLGVALELKASPVSVLVGALSLVGVAPALGLALVMSAGALAFSGQAPVVLSQSGVPTGSLTLAGNAPAQRFEGPGTGSIAFTGAAPSLSIRAVTISPSAGSLTLAGTTPSRIVSGSPSPGTASLALSGQQPAAALAGQSVITPSRGALAFTGYAPAHTFLGPDTGSLVLGGVAPALSVAGTSNAAISPSAGSLAFASDDIEVQFLGPDAGTLTLSGAAPSPAVVVTGITRQPAVGALTLSGVAPTAPIFGAKTPATGALTLTGTTLTPALTSTGLVPTAGLTLAGVAPVASVRGPVLPDSGALTLSGTTATLAYDYTGFPLVGTLTLSGGAPTGKLAIVAAHGTAVLTLTGTTPTYVFAGIAQPLTGTLTLTGYAPSLTPLTILPPVGTLSLSGQQPVVAGIVTPPVTFFRTWTTTTGFQSWIQHRNTFTTWGAS